MTKKFQLSKYISVCVLSFLLLMAMQFVCFSRTVARADGIGDMDTAYPYDQEYFDLFTDSDNLYNPDKDQKNFDIYNYIDSLYKTKISRIEKIPCENSSKYKHGNGSGYPGIICTAGIICTVDGDDPIVKIIPKELFERRGVYLHIGREYGFYVNTQKLEDNSNQSTVFVFDIEKKLLDPEYPSQYIIEIRPLFQYKYCFLTSDYGFDADGKSYSELCYKLNCSMSSVVVPKPEVKVDKVYNTIYSFEETKEYFIKDASFGLALFNEQELNIPDKGYNRDNDNGSFITRTNINFSGVSNQNIWGSGVKPIVKMGLGYIPYVGNIMSVGETIYEVYQNYSNDFRDEISYGDYYSTQYFNSRDEQLEYYSNLTKSGFVSLLSEDEKPLLIGRTNDSDYVKASFTLGMTENWYTRAIDSIKLSIVTEDTNFWGDSTITSRITAERSTKNYLRTINEKTLSLEDSQSFSMLENGCAEFTFDAEYDSDYDLYISNANQMSIKIDGAEKSFSDNKATKYLSAGKHIIRIDGKNSDKLTSNVSITPKNIDGNDYSINALTINGNGLYLLKINSLARVKRLATGNSSVQIKAIYENNRNSYNSYGGITSASEITHPFVRGDYYVVLNNTSLYQETINFSIGEPLTLTSSRTVNSNNSNYTFVRFTGDNSYSKYVLTFSNMEGLSVVAYKNDDWLTGATGEYFPGLFYRITLDPGKTIYIGIKNSSSTSNTLTIKKESNAYLWKIKNEKNGFTTYTSEKNFSVIRDTTLTFKLYVNGETVSNVSYSWENQNTPFGFYKITPDNSKNNPMTLTIDANCPVGGNGIIVYAHPADNANILARIKIIPKMETDIPNIITGMINADGMEFKYSIPSYVCAIDYVIYPSSQEFTQLFSVSQYNKIGNVRFDDFDKNLLSKEQEGSVNFENNYNSLGYTTPQNIKIVIKKIYYLDVDNGIISLSKSMTSEYSINSMFAGGSGTSDSPYQITCKRHFENMLSYNTGEYKLMNDLSLDNRSEFKEFKATLDGDYNMITMTIDTYNTSGDIGLFSTNSGTIKKLKLNAKVRSRSNSSEWQNVGAFCGVNKGTIQSCTLYSYFGESSYLDVSGGSYTYWNVDICVKKHNTSTGGITGNNYGEITYCYNHASICCRGDIGGIAGTSEGYIYSSHNAGRIYYYQDNGVVANRSVGGVVGYQHSGTIKYCENLAKISYDYPKCDNPDIQPCMGRLVGSKQGTVILHTRTGHSTATIGYYLVLVDTGSLYSSEGYWLFGWHNRFDQKIYAGDRPFGKEN